MNNNILLTLIAAVCNVGTIACIKKCKHAVANSQPMVVWMLGIAITILATQFLVLRADIKGASLGLAVSFIIAFVMIGAAIMGVDEESGRLTVVSLKTIPLLETVGYGCAVFGVMLVGISQQVDSVKPATSSGQVAVAENGK
ncbi:hypothetical protein [Pontiella sulfatireligans]|uniref:Uncharacterized protein n=1 Tax=Pontiella sulfatireligans TaxID=2750658 RepID=A0A6C2USU7_9BACT|nr:hypothetical protein [Pontiella sulfatireligans]VGO23033.1 hypothetical protein SCARR_05132 [Pontiella sulfatireligans]